VRDVGRPSTAGDVEREVGELVVVRGDRVAEDHLDVDVGAVRSATPSATRRMLSCTDDRRVCSLTGADRALDLGGLGDDVVGGAGHDRPTVTTAGSNTSTRRVTIVCSACTISQAIGIGSIARNGSLACPPLPVTG
jgi:hypothetical protein